MVIDFLLMLYCERLRICPFLIGTKCERTREREQDLRERENEIESKKTRGEKNEERRAIYEKKEVRVRKQEKTHFHVCKIPFLGNFTRI